MLQRFLEIKTFIYQIDLEQAIELIASEEDVELSKEICKKHDDLNSITL